MSKNEMKQQNTSKEEWPRSPMNLKASVTWVPRQSAAPSVVSSF